MPDDNDDLIILSPELIYMLTNYDRACPSTVFDNVDEPVH